MNSNIKHMRMMVLQYFNTPNQNVNMNTFISGNYSELLEFIKETFNITEDIKISSSYKYQIKTLCSDISKHLK